jgi:acyl carrier protein phosphodiesterase
MNFLAHAYLSFGHPQILVGNVISDFVKGALKNRFEKDIRQGILLHRDIDNFTDNHISTKEAKSIFRPVYRLYSGAIVDILYDHYLAVELENHADGHLDAFAGKVYQTLEEHIPDLPPDFVMILKYMKMQNWLGNYRHFSGMEKSLEGLGRRALYINDMAPAMKLFLTHYNELSSCYASFFPDVKQFAKQRLDQLLC